ncbi:MAG: DUF1573 domain-containing protein [Spirochaetales bacterium]|nr:MAG: DUF1573 domain-containing protein [Spirochaetales bacterium]
MKVNQYVMIAALGAVFVFASCDNPVAELTVLPQISSDTTSLDFGMVEAEAGSSLLSATVTNIGDNAVTVTAVSLSDTTNYSLDAPEAPFTLEPGASQAVSTTFAPAASGTLNASLSITVEGLADPVVLNLTGSGNYRPFFGNGMAVFDWDYTVAGFYKQIGTVNGLPAYKRNKPVGSELDLYLYLYNSDNPNPSLVTASAATANWIIDDTLDQTEYVPLAVSDQNPTAQTPDQAANWFHNQSQSDIAVSAAAKPVLSGFYPANTNIYEGNTIYAYYLYEDKDGDAESGTTYQWYLCDSPTAAGTPISGATGYSFLVPVSQGYVNKYLKVEITPVSTAGFTDGTPVKSDASPEIQFILS